MNPSVGRIVHYFAPRYSVDAPAHLGGQPTGSRVLPAIITYVHNEELVDLVIFGSFENGEEKTSVRINDQALPGTWFWPPRV